LEEYYLAVIRGARRGAVSRLLRLGLRLLSVPYGWAARWRNWLFEHGWKKTYAAAVPVISVGNLTVGGTGKTPCVEYIARFFRERGRRVALLSRGYRAKERRNDEALVLEGNLPGVPHLQAGDRVALARTAVAELASEVLVLDDGFQHRRLKRDLDVVLIDATAPWGHGYLLPRGLLREPASSVSRADLLMLTRCDLVPESELAELRRRARRLAPDVPIVETMHRPAAWTNSQGVTVPLTGLKSNNVAGFCGIGNPEAFRRTLRSLGLGVVAWREFPDHHAYSSADLESLRAWAQALPAGTTIVTTQKDLVKIRLDRLGDHELWALRIDLEVVKGKDVLEERLSKAVLGE
jgi:tetraacyldisaccharide 4'-kinase